MFRFGLVSERENFRRKLLRVDAVVCIDRINLSKRRPSLRGIVQTHFSQCELQLHVDLFRLPIRLWPQQVVRVL